MRNTVSSYLRYLLILASAVVWIPAALPSRAFADVTIVSVSSSDGSVAAEYGPTPGIFTFTRSGGDVSVPLTVNFSMGGTAQQDTDYRMWEHSAHFEAGSTKAYVSILPINTASPKIDQQAVLTLSPDSGYSVGSPNSATVTIKAEYVANFPGVWDWSDIDPQTGLPRITPDLTYLQATMDSRNLNIGVCVGSTGLVAVNKVQIWLDTDQNPKTGDFRQGHVAGMEYRIEADADFMGGYILYKLPTAPPADPLKNPEDIQVATGPATLSGNCLPISIPLTYFGVPQPTGIDLFAMSENSAAGSTTTITTPGVGNRLPEYGVLDATTDKVVVRNPGKTQFTTVSNPAINPRASNGFPLSSATFVSIADQFLIYLKYNQYFDPTNATLYGGPSGYVEVDSDRSIQTGAWFMGDKIPTWGGDMNLFYSINGTRGPGAVLILQDNPSGSGTVVGIDQNDGRWLVQGDPRAGKSALTIAGSLSLYDAVRQVFTGTDRQVVRQPTDGRMYARTTTLDASLRTTSYSLPGATQVIDTSVQTSGGPQILQPFAWDSSAPSFTSVVETDGDTGLPSGQDVTQIVTQIINGNLVMKGYLATWSNSSYDTLFDIWLDTDMNGGTHPLGTICNPPGRQGPCIGADHGVEISAVLGGSGGVYYDLGLFSPDGSNTKNDAMLIANPSFNSGQPGDFTATVPLSALGTLGAQLQMYMSTGVSGGFGMTDVAPRNPMLVPLTNNPAAPQVSITPSSIDFGSVQVGSSSGSQTFTVKNTGSAPLTISNLYLGGQNWQDFPGLQNCYGATLAPGATCFESNTFKPSLAGPESANVTFVDNAADSPQVVSMTGTGIGAGTPGVSVSPASLDFGGVIYETRSDAKTVTVRNTGTATLTISKIYLGGDFEETDNCSSLDPQSSCSFSIRLTPTAVGPQTAYLDFDTNAPSPDDKILVKLTGIGLAPPAPTITPPKLDFGNQPLSTSTDLQSVSLTNTSPGPLHIDGIAMDGSNPGDFVPGTTTCGSYLKAGGTCVTTVAFKPTATGPRSAAMRFYDNAGNSPQTVPLTGTGVQPAPSVKLDHSNLSFGTQQVGTSSSSQSVTLTNSGTAALSIIGVSLQGTNAGDFSQTTTCSGAIAPGGHCITTLTFAPSDTGSRSATLVFADSASDSPQSVGLTGVGTPKPLPAVTLDQTKLDFGSQLLHTTSRGQTVTLTNSGTASLAITSIKAGGDFAQTTSCGSSVDPGGHCTITVTFTPGAVGGRSGTLSIDDNAPDSPQSVQLKGTGVAPPRPHSTVYRAFSTMAYGVAGSSVRSWKDIDPAKLSLSIMPATDSTVILTANADLFSSRAGFHQDLAVSVNGQPVSWKENTDSMANIPRGTAVHAVAALKAGIVYAVRLQWRTNGPDIDIGAGPNRKGVPPTWLTAEVIPGDSLTAVSTASTTQQYALTGSDGKTWKDIDPASRLTLHIRPSSNSTAILVGSADLFASSTGYSQDLGISVNGQVAAWKESQGGLPNAPEATLVHAAIPLKGGVTYTISLQWRAGKPYTGTMRAGAGPSGGKYSPSWLTAELIPASPAASVVSASGAGRYALPASDGKTWNDVAPASKLTLHVTPAADSTATLFASADLASSVPGFNPDLGIFVSGGSYGSGQVVTWTEDGAPSANSPSVAFVHGVLPLQKGVTYTIKLQWKAGTQGSGSLFAGAGSPGTGYSPTWLTAQLVPSG